MKAYRILTILLILIFFVGITFSLTRKIQAKKISPSASQQELQACAVVFPGAQSFVKVLEPLPHYNAFKSESTASQKQFLGIAYLTTDIVPEITGYGGPIKIMVGVDANGTITGVSILSHAETSYYTSGLERFMQQFIGRDAKHSLTLVKDIDAITGATITSEAITQAVGKSLKIVAESLLGISALEEKQEKTSLAWGQILIPLALFTFSILSVFFKSIKMRWLALIGGLGYFGFATATMFSIIYVANIGLLQFPDFQRGLLWYVLVILTPITILLFGNIYCGSLCPFATLEEILYTIFKKFPSKRLTISEAIDSRARYLKYFILFGALIISFAAGKSDSISFEPYILFFSGHATLLGWIFVGLLLVLSLFHYRFWCKYLCPLGAFNGFLSRFSIFKIQSAEKCDACGQCTSVCPTQAIKIDGRGQLTVDSCECIVCGECLRKCPKELLKYQKVSHEEKR